MPDFTRADPSATCNPRHLAQLLGVEAVDIEGANVHVHGTPPANAQNIINAYVYDPDFEREADEIEMRRLRSRALQVFQDPVTNQFTVVQMNRILAALVLRATR